MKRTSVLLALALAAPASAQECPPDNVGCHLADVDFHHRDALFDDISLDSGWVPAGSPLQVRFAVFIGGSTEVDLGGRAVTSWPPALDVALPGRPGTGRLAINYGIQIIARVRIDVTIAGARYNWEGDIPLPGSIPRDLRMANELAFDPFVLPGSMPRPVSVSDDTSRVHLVTLDITDSLIPIPGIGGGFALDAIGSLDAAYQTDRVLVEDGISLIETEGGSTTVRPDPGADGFGAAKDLVILPYGTIDYDGVVTLIPGLFIEILGRRFDLTIAEVPLTIVDLSSSTDFDPATVHVPLPDIDVTPTELMLGDRFLGEVEEQDLTIANEGEAPLEVTVRDPMSPFEVSATSLSIPPRSSSSLTVRFSPVELMRTNATLLLASNDPDEPLIVVRLSGGGLEPAAREA
ncbi:MAG: hypothetical protein K8H88_21285, partial [Sandaracinaceae bacterium]|nr:hypothetical protein [Sandaracinaceae bacterium]